MKSTQTSVVIGGRAVKVISLINDQKMEVELLSLGGIITKIIVPDQEGKLENVVLAYQDLETYAENPPFFGTIVGRTSGRIHKGKVTINGEIYQFPINNNDNSLHGGNDGFNTKVWDVALIENEENVAAQLSYTSPDGEEGYPGNLKTKVTYTLNNHNELTIRYEAISDKDTLVNLTNHTYFNLSGEAKAQVLDHMMQIDSEKVCELDADSIPTGNWINLKEQPEFDFNTPKLIGKDIDAPGTRLQSGYDHPWLLSKNNEIDAYYHDPVSGRVMEIITDEKAVVVYAMNFADPLVLANGKVATPRYGICFETQSLPIGYGECHKEDSMLSAGKKYDRQTTFRFSKKA
ncbi:MAG: aldose epimerase family protein [Cellulosilyticaceae bacterium]